MVETGDRQYIYKLRREECLLLLKDLGKEEEVSGSVHTLRAKLTSLARKATPA